MFQRSDDHRDLHSFTTRRSSDLGGIRTEYAAPPGTVGVSRRNRGKYGFGAPAAGSAKARADATVRTAYRSEEHTSELQSPYDLVCRLLLEKKKPEGAARLVDLEGFYSMLGQIAPLKELAAVSNGHCAILLVDEAHSMSFIGSAGRGLVGAHRSAAGRVRNGRGAVGSSHALEARRLMRPAVGNPRRNSPSAMLA